MLRINRLIKPFPKRFIHYLRDTTQSSSILTNNCLNVIEEIYKKNKETYDNAMYKRFETNKYKNYGFRDDTKFIRDDAFWRAAPVPPSLIKRNVEITGPGNNAKMVINAFNSNADGYMCDLEDSLTPSWSNIINAQYNIKKAVRGELKEKKFDKNGNLVKKYTIDINNSPSFFVRTRGLHMNEEHVLVKNKPIPATFFDLVTFMYHNAKYLEKEGRGPYLYIPKLESYEEACLIDDVLKDTQEILNIPVGTAKVTCLIETYPAIFQTEEIIYGLKDHIVGLNCGRWDYLYSIIKSNPEKILPYRDELTMDKNFMESYVRQIVYSCHKRGISAIGGMSAFIPTKDKKKNSLILKKILADKETEIRRGCDGAWVAHPGLVEPIKKLFEKNLPLFWQGSFIPDKKPTFNELSNIKSSTNIIKTEFIEKNMSSALQYISAWLSGNGAVALNNLMEDLATAEIAISQLKQWYNNKIMLYDTNLMLHSYSDIEYNNLNNNMKQTTNFVEFNRDTLTFELEKAYKKMCNENEVNYADRYFDNAKEILEEYITSDAIFLSDVATKYLNIDKGFKGIKWDSSTYNKISSSKGHLSGLELTKLRGDFLNKYLYEDNNPAYKFLGTSNGVSAVNVVAGGHGKVGPYAGGWQHNAMKNRLNMCLPDTLHVTPEESGNCAEEINNHLQRADTIQHLLKLDNPDIPIINYYDMALLCDLEQGWCTPEKTRIGTIHAIKNGINVIHIEDQGEKKRCGHLGDKELNTYDDYALMLKSANLAAQELLGPEQARKQWVRFVARTDALSAKRIHNSNNLCDKENPEHKFIDWERGVSPDGKYLYLKQGINQETGNSWGLDLSIYRCARVVDEGLASHVWMETPDPDLHIAKKFMDGINDILLPKGKKAYSLYNHSPSFDWDVKFHAEAKKLTEKILEFHNENSLVSTDSLKTFLENNGDEIQGDNLFTKLELENIYKCLIDIRLGPTNYDKYLVNNGGYISSEIKKTIVNLNTSPEENITNIIVERRLINFGHQLSKMGCNMHLITLPEFHVTAYNMHILSRDFKDEGINAFVKNVQRPERIHSLNDYSYTYYKHQTATGTGIEAAFNKSVGSYDVNTLDNSTEQDDIKKRID